MKRDLLIMFLLASLLVMTGCSQENIPGGDDGVEDAQTSYLAVNLVSSDATGTRADGNGFEDGSAKENTVNKVRFYFFNGGGGTVDVRYTASGYVNFYDWENPTPDTGNPGDVEKILTATIVIDTKKGDRLPVRIAAVINPDNVTGLGNTSLSLTSLKGIAQDYAFSDLAKDEGAGKFVMFNSVYVENGTDFSTTDIKSSNICTTETLAKENPVIIHVERSVAKVSVELGDNVKAADGGKIALKDKVTGGENILVGGKQVYLKLGGWELAAETDKGRLVKKINPQWEGTWWKPSAYPHRTFWAINYLGATNVYDKSYSQTTTPFGAANYLYTNENAQKNDGDYSGNARNSTKVIVQGTLVDVNDQPFTIVRHMGTRFADDPDNFNNLKNSVLAVLENKGYFYYYKDGENFRQITNADLDVVVPTTVTNENSGSNCYVYTKLNSTAEAKQWYKSTVKDPAQSTAYTQIQYSEINGTLKDKKADNSGYIIDRALVWKSGMTYYYYEIKHLDGCNVPSVVRNHIYKTTITNIAGLGTPVYNPGDIIYPEKPDEKEYYIAAQVKILSWRVVSTNYDLEW